jgi:anti-sigma factor (TIGR02949 family)
MMNCSDTRGRINPYLDGELGMDENVQVVRHLETCPGCSAVFEGERLLFDELRRTAAGPPAPAGLRMRISSDLRETRVASRPWPFARALVPAAAAAVLLAIFISFFTSQPVEAMARRAVAWHDQGSARVVPVSTAPELDRYYGSQGKKACLHERTVNAGMKYAYKSATVEKSGPGGSDTCWWIATCPTTGCRLTHACFPAPQGIEKVWDGKRRVVPVGDRTVIMNYRNGQVCLFVFDNAREAERFQAVSNASRP